VSPARGRKFNPTAELKMISTAEANSAKQAIVKAVNRRSFNAQKNHAIEALSRQLQSLVA
jgi:hypothetical protein